MRGRRPASGPRVCLPNITCRPARTRSREVAPSARHGSVREQKAAEKTDAVLTRETTIVMTPKPVALVSGVLCALAAWAGAWRPCAGRLTSAQRRSPQQQPIDIRCRVQPPQIPLSGRPARGWNVRTQAQALMMSTPCVCPTADSVLHSPAHELCT